MGISIPYPLEMGTSISYPLVAGMDMGSGYGYPAARGFPILFLLAWSFDSTFGL